MKISTMKCALWVLACLTAVPTFAASCDSLATLALPDTTITMAQVVPAGEFSVSGDGQAKGKSANLTRIFPNSAAWQRRSSPPAIPISKSNSGSRPAAGTASYSQWEMEVGPE